MLSLLFLIKSLIRSVMTAICQADGKTWSITGGARVAAWVTYYMEIFLFVRDYVMFIYAFAFVFH